MGTSQTVPAPNADIDVRIREKARATASTGEAIPYHH
jgi:hypothetical protein